MPTRRLVAVIVLLAFALFNVCDELGELEIDQRAVRLVSDNSSSSDGKAVVTAGSSGDSETKERYNENDDEPEDKDMQEEKANTSSHPYRNTGVPNILLAGAQKASTSSLAYYLMNQPHICFSDPKQALTLGSGKESHFFDRPDRFDRGLPYFRDLYKHCSSADDILFDGTPETMMHPKKVKEIYEKNGQPAGPDKMLMILREPVSREISWYNHKLRILEEHEDPPGWAKTLLQPNSTTEAKPFRTVMEQTVIPNFSRGVYDWQYGTYAHWLRQWFELFDRSTSILILSFDELQRDPNAVLARVHAFLDLPAVAPLELPHKNTNSKHYPNPPCADQLELASYFEGPNRELYELLESHPGPAMEERPFPEFQLACAASETTTTTKS